jgi:hypothetical protein
MLNFASVPLHVPRMLMMIYGLARSPSREGKKKEKGKAKTVEQTKELLTTRATHTLCATSVRTSHRKDNVVPRAQTWTVAEDGGHEETAMCVCVRSEREAREQTESAE